MKPLTVAAVTACAAAALAAGPTAGTAGTTPGLPAALPPSPAGLAMTVAPVSVPSSLTSFRVYDATGALLRTESFRVTPAGGNCCEKYVATTPGGRLLELGGSYPYFSDDGGATWQSARPPVPLVNGEGALTATPTGDVVGAAWDAFSGDRLVTYKYTAADGTWRYHEMPMHGPFFDRPWVTVVEGPFTTPDGATVPWISFVRGGSGINRDVELVSYDGLVYTEVAATSPVADAFGTLPAPGPVADADTDWVQPHAQSRIAPLPGTGAIRRQESGLLCRSRAQILRPDRAWACLDLGTEQLTGDIRVDGRGWLHEVRYAGATVTYRVSTNGGTTWQATTFRLPGTAPSLAGTRPDVKVDTARSVAYVALRASGTGTSGGQDLVLRFGHAGGTPALRDYYRIGRGDLVAGSMLGDSGPRFDFATIAILPDGRFAVAYDDTTTTSPNGIQPWLAIQQ